MLVGFSDTQAVSVNGNRAIHLHIIILINIGHSRTRTNIMLHTRTIRQTTPCAWKHTKRTLTKHVSTKQFMMNYPSLN